MAIGLRACAGGRLALEQVVVRDLAKPRDVRLPAGMMSTDLQRITGDPEITTVAQLVGGIEPARTIMLQLLAAGKDVVTANKALLAEHGPELFDAARRAESLDRVRGGGGGRDSDHRQYQSMPVGQSDIVDSWHFERHLQFPAHANGRPRRRAMPPPWPKPSAAATPKPIRRSMSTAPTRCKSWRSLRIWRSASGRNGARFPRGIDQIDAADLRYARELGYRIRLLAVARLGAAGLDLHVSPTLVPHGTPLAEVRGASMP